MDIGHIIDEKISPENLQHFRRLYMNEAMAGEVSPNTQFSYAHALLKSTKNDVKDGITLLEEFLKRNEESIPKRDIVYYLAVGYTKLTDYDKALMYVDHLLSVEENNRQAIELKKCIVKRMKSSGLWGAAIIGAGVIGVAGLTLSAIFSGKK
uniref:Mitochondrial fission 1 protein n=1 Tax=Parastrongyloides trichosuri TaxID=131310 RepID=A0A0N4ZKQ7_PARTI